MVKSYPPIHKIPMELCCSILTLSMLTTMPGLHLWFPETSYLAQPLTAMHRADTTEK
jgi:hypothetical protein